MKPTRTEFAALCFALLLTIGMAHFGQYHPKFYPADYAVYRGIEIDYYYPYWAKFIFAPFALLPFWIGYILWTGCNILCLYISARLLQGNIPMLMLSHPMVWTIYYGQIVGVIVLGLALVYSGVQRNQPLRAGIGLALALIKPQMGLAALLWILLWPRNA